MGLFKILCQKGRNRPKHKIFKSLKNHPTFWMVLGTLENFIYFHFKFLIQKMGPKMALNHLYLQKYKELWAETSAMENSILVNIM